VPSAKLLAVSFGLTALVQQNDLTDGVCPTIARRASFKFRQSVRYRAQRQHGDMERDVTTSPETYTGVSIETDPLVTTKNVWKRYDVCDRTIDRWVANPAMNFPKPVIINKRRYWRVSELVAWERQRAAGRVSANV
jgi:hypothetical protein